MATFFDQLISQIASQQAAQREHQGTFVPIEENPTWPTGMKRPPIRADLGTGQLTLPLPERAIPGQVIQPSGLEAAGVATLPWDRTVAGAPEAVPSSFGQKTSVSTLPSGYNDLKWPERGGAPAYETGNVQTAMGVAHQEPFLDAKGKIVQDLMGGATNTAGLLGKKGVAAATGAGPLTVGDETVAKMLGSKTLGRGGMFLQNKLPEGLLGKMPTIQGLGKVSPEMAAASEAAAAKAAAAGGEEGLAAVGKLAGAKGLGMKVLGATAIPGAIGFGGQAAMKGLGISDKLAQNKNLNPAEAAFRDAIQGGTVGGFFGGPGAAVGAIGAGLAGGLMELINDDPNNQGVRQVLENTVGKVPVVKDIAHIFGIGAPEQAPQEADPQNAQLQMMAQAGFGNDPADVTRRSGTYDSLIGAGIDQDIAFEVAYGDTSIGQKVKGAKGGAGSPLGNLDLSSARLQQRTQPYIDQMNASAADLQNHISGSPFLQSMQPALVDLTKSNAAALQADAVQYPYLLDAQTRGDALSNYWKSVYGSTSSGGGGGMDTASLMAAINQGG